MMIGKYEILGELGKGGMGKVLLGYDPTLDCKVAIKAVRAEAVEATQLGEMENRLLREARAAAKLDHPGIVAIREFLREGDCGYIVMKLVQGKTLDRVSPLSQPADPAFALRVLRDCAGALDHAHARNIVHRDIKPGNIMIDDETGAAQITDFGIAKFLDAEHHTEPGLILGTFEYMAPEQLSPGKLDGKVDQFALAVIAYRMLTGAPLYAADTMRRLSYQITVQPPPQAHEANPALPLEADAVLAKALAKKPEDRYPSCREFAAALEAAFGFAPSPPSGISAPLSTLAYEAPATTIAYTAEDYPLVPPATPVKSGKWIGILITALVVIALVIGIAILRMRQRENTAAIVTTPPGPTAVKTLEPFLSFPSGNMVLVEAGMALLGPERKPVNVAAFYIDKTEVTNEAYLAFCRVTGHAAPPGADTAAPQDPVVNVNFEDARAFAKWTNKRLPTAYEWEKAARGSQGQIYPWGNEWKSGVTNIRESKDEKTALMPADSLAGGASPSGVLNMIGNAWEWIDKQDIPDDKAFQLLSESQMARNLHPPLSRAEAMYHVRGGSFRYFFDDTQKPTLVWDALVMPARLMQNDLGFRCARSPKD